MDWVFLNFVPPGASDAALLLSNARASVLALAAFAILLSSKWITWGHARTDVLLALPLLVALVMVWSGMTVAVIPQVWGNQLIRDPVRYAVYVLALLGYFLASCILAVSLIFRRRDLPRRLKTPAFLSVLALLLLVALWLGTNVLTNLTLGPGQPLFSSVLFLPALLAAIAFAPRSAGEMGEIFRAVSAVPRRVTGLYVFYRTGEPLVALGVSRSLPIEAEQLEGILSLVGNFVETSMRKPRGYAVTSMQFERLGILAVRGRAVIVAVIFEGPAYDALRSELRRSMEAFEDAHAAELETLEGAARIADIVADDLASLLHRPEPGAPGTHAK